MRGCFFKAGLVVVLSGFSIPAQGQEVHFLMPWFPPPDNDVSVAFENALDLGLKDVENGLDRWEDDADGGAQRKPAGRVVSGGQGDSGLGTASGSPDGQHPGEHPDEPPERTTQALGNFSFQFQGEVIADVQNDFVFQSGSTHDQDVNDTGDGAGDDIDQDRNELSAAVEVDIDAYIAKPLFINLDATLSAFLDSEVGADRKVSDYDVFVEALSINWENGRWSFIGGKFVPHFSIAYEEAPGIYGSELAEDDIELSDRIGLGGRVTFPGSGFGIHSLSSSVFFADTTALSGSFIRSAPSRSNIDGANKDDGPGNTERLNSFAVALDGSDFASLPGLSYHIGGARQAVDRVLDDDGDSLPSDEIANEYRFVAASEWEIALSDAVTVAPLLEYVHFWNGGGKKDESRDYVTASTLVEYENWNLAFSYTGRLIESPDETNDTTTLFQVSGGYMFDDLDLGVDIGYRFLDQDDNSSHTFGVYVFYMFDFAAQAGNSRLRR